MKGSPKGELIFLTKQHLMNAIIGVSIFVIVVGGAIRGINRIYQDGRVTPHDDRANDDLI